MTNRDERLDPETSPLSRAYRVEQACERFEAAWRAGQRPGIAGYLAEVRGRDARRCCAS
jgi:hypothetical protein